MSDSILDLSSLGLFVASSVAFLVLPGPAVLYIVTRSLDQGRKAGLVSTLGITCGTLVHVTAAAFGLSAILVHSATAFMVIKYAGAAYLIGLGIAKLRERDAELPTEVAPKRLRRLFVDGAVVNLLNPKTALFFFAFLPQFADPERGSLSLQILLLGTIFVAMAMITDSAWALAAGSARLWIRRRPGILRAQRRVAAGVYLSLGVGAAWSAAS